MDTKLSETGRPARGGRYRHHPVEFKRAVVERSLQTGISVSRLAREHGINANQVFAWRKAYHEGRLGVAAFLPVRVAPEVGVSEVEAQESSFGRLIIERRDTRLTIEGQPDAQILSQILAALLR